MECVMKKALELVRGLREDEDGAALVEYTVLLGIMLVAVIASIIFVGGWVNNKWVALTGALATAP
jgi:pilus assembly protein Flp/PilA